MFCLDLKRDNKNCSSIAAYYNSFSMNFEVQAHFTSAITKILAPLQRNITISILKACIFRFMHTRLKIFMFCLDLKRDNKNCSSTAAYYNSVGVISMTAQFTSAITKIVAPLKRNITVSMLKA